MLLSGIRDEATLDAYAAEQRLSERRAAVRARLKPDVERRLANGVNVSFGSLCKALHNEQDLIRRAAVDKEIKWGHSRMALT